MRLKLIWYPKQKKKKLCSPYTFDMCCAICVYKNLSMTFPWMSTFQKIFVFEFVEKAIFYFLF